jgi:hypothetical protein
MKFFLILVFSMGLVFGQVPTYESKNVIIYNIHPDSTTIVFWGGLNYATPKWLASQTPKKKFLKYNIIFLSYFTPLETAKKIYHDKLGYKLKPKILLGFSRGGLMAQKYYSQNLQLVGYIDPVLKPNFENLSYSNVVFVYNPYTWGAKYSKTLMNYGKIIGRKKGFFVIQYLDHIDFPKYFFKEHL